MLLFGRCLSVIYLIGLLHITDLQLLDTPLSKIHKHKHAYIFTIKQMVTVTVIVIYLSQNVVLGSVVLFVC